MPIPQQLSTALSTALYPARSTGLFHSRPPHFHTWSPQDGKLSKNCLSRFLKRLTNGDAIDKEYRTFATPQRIIGHRGDSGSDREYLVKWSGLPYSECSWELAGTMPIAAIDAYNVASNRVAVEAAKQQREREMSWLTKGKRSSRPNPNLDPPVYPSPLPVTLT